METSNHLTESWSQPWQSVLSSQLWRLEHLYWIENKAGQLQRFSLNRAQRRLHERLWYRNDILKARQLGISTYVAMLMLDMSLFRSNFHCGIIDKSLPDAQQKLAKLRFAWDHLDYVPPDPSAMDVALARLGERIKSLSGVEHLELYRSRPPGAGGSVVESPVHDGHSHTADAARTFAEAWSHGLLHGPGNDRGRGRRARMW